MSSPDSLKLDVVVQVNSLSVDGEALSPDTSPEALRTILQVGHIAILEGIEETYEATRKRLPDHEVVRPSVFVLRLGTNSQIKRVLTDAGQSNGTSIHRELSELKDRYHPYWRAIADNGFTPEVRSGLSGPNVGGIWLMLRALEESTEVA